MEAQQIIHGDCLEAMAGMAENSIDAIVTDPPYGLEFMGKDWDKLSNKPRGRTAGMQVDRPTIETEKDTPYHRASVKQPASLKRCAKCGGNSSGKWNRCQCETSDFRSRSDLAGGMQQWHYEWAVAALRVAKPGAFLLAFGGTRTFHRLACAIEDAGWEIRDTIMWVYGSGFPKSLNISKAIDKAAGAEREVIEQVRVKGGGTEHINRGNKDQGFRPGEYQKGENVLDITAPATELAKLFDGYGSALKPAYEPIIVAMKPLDGTFASNAEKWGVAGINIDGCRVPANGDKLDGGRISTTTDGWDRPWKHDESAKEACRERGAEAVAKAEELGRWPANLIHDGSDEVVELFPQSKGQQGDVRGTEPSTTGDENTNCYGEYGRVPFGKQTDQGSAARFFYCAKASKVERNGSKHPTVKPLALMRYLVRMVRPPAGGTILDPFLGSGTTIQAAQLEHVHAIGIEKDANYVQDAQNRLNPPPCPENVPATSQPRPVQTTFLS